MTRHEILDFFSGVLNSILAYFQSKKNAAGSASTSSTTTPNTTEFTVSNKMSLWGISHSEKFRGLGQNPDLRWIYALQSSTVLGKNFLSSSLANLLCPG